jgi:hypothetical protein
MYKFYPSILDSFNYYRRSETSDKQELIDKINRVKTPPSEAMLTGINLEKTVNNELEYTGLIMDKKLSLDVLTELKEHCQGWSQVYLESVIDYKIPVLLYGYADYIYADTIRDLKYTGKYEFPKYHKGTQHAVYLMLGQKMGFNSKYFQYVICDLKNIYLEDYILNDFAKDSLEETIHSFIDFIEEHRPLIRNKKIYGEV